MPVAHQKEKCRAAHQYCNDCIVKGDNDFFRKFLGSAIKIEVGKKASNEPSQSNDEGAHEYPTGRYCLHRLLVKCISKSKSNQNSEQVRYVLCLYIQQMGTAQFHACKCTTSAAILPISFADLSHENE